MFPREILNFPKEILRLIFYFIQDPKSFFNILQVNKEINEIASGLIQKKKSNVEPMGFLREVKKNNKVWYVLPNGKREGECKIWNENGQLRTHCFYKNGKLEGEYKNWRDNGKLDVNCFYKDDKYEGEYKEWHENGQLWVCCFHKEDKLEGEYKGWYKNGQLWAHRFYKEDKVEKNHIL